MSRTSSFSSDDRGVTGPYTDLPALGLVAIGTLLFAYLMFSAYASYEAKAYYADRKEDLRTLAVAIAADPHIAWEGMSGMLDAQKLNNASCEPEAMADFGIPGENVYAMIEAGHLRWAVGKQESGGRSASYRLPITVRLNDAGCLSGTLTVTATEGG